MQADSSIRQRPARRKRRKPLIRVIFGLVLWTLVIWVSIGAGVFAYWLLKSPPLRQVTAAAITGGLSPARTFPKADELNVLVLGKDEDRNNKGQIVNTKGRTDAILVAHFDFKRRKVNVLSVPRDTLVRIPGYSRRHKINAANAFGGPDLARRTVENLLDIDIDGYALVDYRMFEKLIDNLGGVTVMVDKPLHYDDNWGQLHIHLRQGMQQLDGKQALGLVRYRKSNDGHGSTDQERIGRQQRLLASVKSKISHPSNLIKIPDLISLVIDGSQTNLSIGQAACLANFARSIGQQAVRMETLPSRPVRSALRMDRAKARELVNELFFEREANRQPG